MSARAETVSGTLTTIRNCTIEINNFSNRFSLVNPQVYTSSGYCSHPPKPTVRPNTTEVCAFTKFSHSVRGAVGVLTYDLSHEGKRMAIMFSVPFDYIWFKNWFALGVFDNTGAYGKSLYKKMYYDNGTKFTRSEAIGSVIEYKTAEVCLRATMSNVGKAIIKVELSDVAVE